MTEPILIVDPGAASTSAAIVADGESQLLKEPSSGSYYWPTSVALVGDVLRVGTIAERRKRSNPLLYVGHLTERVRLGEPVTLGDRSYLPHEPLAALLSVLRAEAERLGSTPVSRLLMLTAEERDPAAAVGRTMISAATAAGFTDVELFFLPAAVTMAVRPPDTTSAARLVLVCDAGASALRLTLMRTEGGPAGVMRTQTAATACGGDNLDALLTAAIQKKNARWLRPLLAAAEPAGGRSRMDLADLARRVRHQLTDADHAEDTLTALTPVVRFTRRDLERLVRPAIGELRAACRQLLARAGSGSGTGVMSPAGANTEISDVILVGGCARSSVIQQALGTVLGRMVTPEPWPELAALRGGIEWARSASSRRVSSVPVPVGLRGLAWDIPGGAARLTGWIVPPGAAFGAGEPLARIRTEDDAVWDLVSDGPGILEQPCAGTDAIVATADVLAVVRKTAASPSDRRDSPLRLAVVRGGTLAAFGRDGRQLVTLDAAGVVRIWDAETAAELNRFDVGPRVQRRCLDAAMKPNGHWSVAFFDGTAVVIADVTATTQTARFARGADVNAVRLSADGRRLCTIEAERTRIWDGSGHELLSVNVPPLSSDAVTTSRDGRWLAFASSSGIEVWDQTTRTGTVARPLARFKSQVWQMTFSSDATRILFAADTKIEMIMLPAGEVLWATDVPGPVHCADFAPDDRLAATASHSPAGSVVRILDTSTGRETGRIDLLDGPAEWVKFSPDGRFLACCSGDNTVLWALMR